MTKVSIIVPCYNVAEYISACISSILAQTYKNLQIICIDDGSTDETGDKLDRFAMIDDRIDVIHQKNLGLSCARNAGLVASKGEYIVLVDGDDYIDIYYVEKLVEAAQKTNSDIVICRYKEDRNGKIKKVRGLQKRTILSRKEMLSEFLSQKLRTGAMVWNKLYKAKIFRENKIKFLDGKIHEDNFVMPEIYKSINKAAIIPNALYFYRQNKNSIMNRKSKERLKDALESIEYAKKLLKSENLSTELEAYEMNQKFYLYTIYKDKNLKKYLKKRRIMILKNPYTSKTLKLKSACFLR